jgi:hypothetical protein
MTPERREIDSGLPPEERQALSQLADRLERERPLPAAAFRGNLRRLLVAPRKPAPGAPRWQALAASYAGLGVLLLAVAAVGLAGGGPFAA